jgi:hypothetical protein
VISDVSFPLLNVELVKSVLEHTELVTPRIRVFTACTAANIKDSKESRIMSPDFQQYLQDSTTDTEGILDQQA